MTDVRDSTPDPVPVAPGVTGRATPLRFNRRNKPASTEMAHGAAMQKVSAAAKAAGLTVQELANLISDAGLLAEAPPDGITEVLSLQDLGERLHTLSCTTPISERAKWFAGLVPTQQKALITVLRERGYATATIAQEYDIDPLLVVQAHNEFADNLGRNVINTRLSTLAGHMMLVAERAQQGAMEKADWASYWRITKEMVSTLQSMGIIDRAAQRIEIDGRVSVGVEEKEAELERIIRVTQLKKKRLTEIEQSRGEDDLGQERGSPEGGAGFPEKVGGGLQDGDGLSDARKQGPGGQDHRADRQR